MIIGTGRTASNVFVGRDQPATGIYLGTNDLKARAYIMVIAFTSTNKCMAFATANFEYKTSLCIGRWLYKK